MNVPAFWQAPSFADPALQRRGQLLYRVLLCTSPVLLALTAATFAGGDVWLGAVYAVQVLAVCIALVLLRRDRFEFAALVFLLSIWTSSSVNAVLSGGPGSSAMGSFAIIVLCAGFFWSSRGALVFVSLSALLLAAMLYWSTPLGLSAPLGGNPLRYFGELVGQLFATAVILHFALRFIAKAEGDKHAVELAALAREAELQDQLREAQRFEALGRLSAGVAHDFNNLLTGISGTLGLMRFDEGDSHEAHLDQLDEIVLRAQHLSAQLLDVGRRSASPSSEVELDLLLNKLRGLLQTLLGAQVELDLRLDADGLRARADPSELERIVVNLVTNAGDALEGVGRVRLETAREGSMLRLSVIDDGAGMSEEVRAQVFEPFFTTKGERGTGLGLATSRNIVTRSGGSIEVESTLGEGTKIHLRLPACDLQ